MRAALSRTAVLLLVAGMIASLTPVCGCGSTKTTPVGGSSSTSPAGTTPSDATGTGDPEAALAKAKAEGMPVLVKFGSGTCIPCKQIEENIDQVRPEYEGKVAFVIVDVYDPRSENLTDQYGIETIPTTFFLGGDGGIVNKVVGVMEPDQLRRQLDTLL